MTTLTSPSTEKLKEQVDLILHSPVFSTSETLRKLLAYLAAHAVEGRPELLKVREIAVDVFGRAQDFDSQSDSVVRVHTGRLRSKLAEYYMDDGVDDEVIITIPKGGYALTSHFRHASAPRSTEPLSASDMAETSLQQLNPVPDPPPPLPGRSKLMVSGRFLLLSLIVVAIAAWMASSYFHQRAERNQVPAVLRTFWQDFANPNENSLLVFSNFRFLNTGASGLQTYTGPDDPQKPILDTYTTMGEVMGVYSVSRTLLLMGKMPEAKRSRFLTWDEAKDSNLVFVGGPLAETPLRDFTLLKDLGFKVGMLRDRQVGTISNNRPRAGEAPVYFASDSVYSFSDVHTSKVDYAIIALRSSFNANHRNLVLAGISEYGTQGASDFVTNEGCVKELLSRLGVRPGQRMPQFEALIRVRVEGGVPVKSDLVLVHLES